MLLTITSLYETYQKKVTLDMYRRLKGLSLKVKLLEYDYNIEHNEFDSETIRQELSSSLGYEVPIQAVKACMNLVSLSRFCKDNSPVDSIVVTDIDPLEIIKGLAVMVDGSNPEVSIHNTNLIKPEKVAKLLSKAEDVLFTYGSVTGEVEDIISLSEDYKESRKYHIDPKSVSKEQDAVIGQDFLLLREVVKDLTTVSSYIINKIGRSLSRMFKDDYSSSVFSVLHSTYRKVVLGDLTSNDNPSLITDMSSDWILRDVLYNVEDIKPYVGRIRLTVS